jgi:magnesium-transporting ATPase (P-type)
VGDFVKVLSEEIIPADIVLMYSTEENGTCYVETSNLTGYTIHLLKIAESQNQKQLYGQYANTSE